MARVVNGSLRSIGSLEKQTCQEPPGNTTHIAGFALWPVSSSPVHIPTLPSLMSNLPKSCS